MVGFVCLRAVLRTASLRKMPHEQLRKLILIAASILKTHSIVAGAKGWTPVPMPTRLAVQMTFLLEKQVDITLHCL